MQVSRAETACAGRVPNEGTTEAAQWTIATTDARRRHGGTA